MTTNTNLFNVVLPLITFTGASTPKLCSLTNAQVSALRGSIEKRLPSRGKQVKFFVSGSHELKAKSDKPVTWVTASIKEEMRQLARALALVEEGLEELTGWVAPEGHPLHGKEINILWNPKTNRRAVLYREIVMVLNRQRVVTRTMKVRIHELPSPVNGVTHLVDEVRPHGLDIVTSNSETLPVWQRIIQREYSRRLRNGPLAHAFSTTALNKYAHALCILQGGTVRVRLANEAQAKWASGFLLEFYRKELMNHAGVRSPQVRQTEDAHIEAAEAVMSAADKVRLVDDEAALAALDAYSDAEPENDPFPSLDSLTSDVMDDILSEVYTPEK